MNMLSEYTFGSNNVKMSTICCNLTVLHNIMLNSMLHASDWLFCQSIHSHKIVLLFMRYLKQAKNGLRYQIRMWQTVHHSLCLIHLHNQLNTKHNWYVCLVLRGITLSWAKGKLKLWKLKFWKLILIKRHACLQDCNTCLNINTYIIYTLSFCECSKSKYFLFSTQQNHLKYHFNSMPFTLWVVLKEPLLHVVTYIQKKINNGKVPDDCY